MVRWLLSFQILCFYSADAPAACLEEPITCEFLEIQLKTAEQELGNFLTSHELSGLPSNKELTERINDFAKTRNEIAKCPGREISEGSDQFCKLPIEFRQKRLGPNLTFVINDVRALKGKCEISSRLLIGSIYNAQDKIVGSTLDGLWNLNSYSCEHSKAVLRTLVLQDSSKIKNGARLNANIYLVDSVILNERGEQYPTSGTLARVVNIGTDGKFQHSLRSISETESGDLKYEFDNGAFVTISSSNFQMKESNIFDVPTVSNGYCEIKEYVGKGKTNGLYGPKNFTYPVFKLLPTGKATLSPTPVL